MAKLREDVLSDIQKLADLLVTCRTAILDRWDEDHEDTFRLISDIDALFEPRRPMHPDDALQALLKNCPHGGYPSRERREGALAALEDLEYWLSGRGDCMPNGPGVVASLVADGYCNKE